MKASSRRRHASNSGDNLGKVGQLAHGQHVPRMGRRSPYIPTLQTTVISKACHLSTVGQNMSAVPKCGMCHDNPALLPCQQSH